MGQDETRAAPAIGSDAPCADPWADLDRRVRFYLVDVFHWRERIRRDAEWGPDGRARTGEAALPG